MKKLLKTLYLLTPNTYLHCQNEAISICVGQEETRIPAHMLDSIVCIGNTTVSTPLIAYCGEHGISLSFHSDSGRFYGRIYGSVNGNVLLRKRQFQMLSEEAASVDFVRNVLYGKFKNSRMVLMKSEKDIENTEKKMRLKRASNELADAAKTLETASNVDTMRGIEGAAAQCYFRVFDDMLKTEDAAMQFKRRSKRPPENNVNALMSFLYMMLKNQVQSALESVGLDPACGYLHALRPGKPALALDLMEELRAPLCDRMALSLVNLRQIQVEDFAYDGDRIILSDKAKRVVVEKWQSRMKETITHNFLGEKIPIGLISYTQAMLFARVIRGDLDSYLPFIWR